MDLYNMKLEIYVFVYNEYGSIAAYHIKKEDALSDEKEDKTSKELIEEDTLSNEKDDELNTSNEGEIKLYNNQVLAGILFCKSYFP